MTWLARFSPSLRKKIARMGITTNPASAAGGLFDCRRGTLDIRAMTLEEDSDLVGLLISPPEVISEVVGNFSGGDSVRQGGNCREELARAPAKFRKETVGEKHG